MCLRRKQSLVGSTFGIVNQCNLFKKGPRFRIWDVAISLQKTNLHQRPNFATLTSVSYTFKRHPSDVYSLSILFLFDCKCLYNITTTDFRILISLAFLRLHSCKKNSDLQISKITIFGLIYQ